MYRRSVKTSLVSKRTGSGSSSSSLTSMLSSQASKRSPSPEDMFSEPKSPVGSPVAKKKKPVILEDGNDENDIPLSQMHSQGNQEPVRSPRLSQGALQKRNVKDTLPSTSGNSGKLLERQLVSTPPRTKAKSKRNASPKPPLLPSTSSRTSSFLHDTVFAAGMTLSSTSYPNVLNTEQAVFIRNLSKQLNSSQNGSSAKPNQEKFLKEFEAFVSDPTAFKTALSPTKTDPSIRVARGEFQDCIVKLLLNIDEIQVQLMNLLLDKFAELTLGDSLNENEEGDKSTQNSLSVRSKKVAWARLILQPMRLLNRIIEPKTLIEKLFDIIHASPPVEIQHEIVLVLPDIVGDDDTEQVVNEFINLMKTEKALTPSILLTLEVFTLEPDALNQLQIGLIKVLRRCPIDQLPACIWFLLSKGVSGSIDEILNGIRSELVLCHAESSSTQVTQYKNPDVDYTTTKMLVFEKAQNSLLVSRKLGEVWIKNIAKVKSHTLHKPIDLMMLVLLHSTATDAAKKKVVETTLRSKIKTGGFRHQLVLDTFSALMIVIKTYFRDLLKLVTTLLTSSDPVILEYGKFIILECFKQDEMMWKKAIILNLVQVVHTNPQAGLDILHSLATMYTLAVSSQVTQIMLLTDSLTTFTIPQVRLLMDIICMIAFSDDGSFDMESLQNEIHIMVCKQLDSSNPCIFRSGVVSASMMIRHMIAIPEGHPNPSPPDDVEDIELNGKAEKAFSLLEMLIRRTKSKSEAQLLAFDQLSHIILSTTNLDKSFMKKMSNVMKNTLQSHFIIDSADFVPKDSGLDATLQHCIDTDLEIQIALNLTEAVVNEESESGASWIVVRTSILPGLIRLIRGLEIDDLTEIDGLLGCALSLPSPKQLSKFSVLDLPVQKLSLDCLFLACNWFREIVNTFVYLVREGKPDKILMRIRLIVHLQALISSCMSKIMTTYTPPVCYGGSPTKSSSDKPKRKKGNKKSSKDANEDDESGEDTPETTSLDLEDDNVQEIDSTECETLAPFLRELDFDVANVLSQPLTLTPTPIKDGRILPEFGPKELSFILSDLVGKLKHTLPGRQFPGAKMAPQIGYDNVRSLPIDHIVKGFSKMTQHLSKHLQKIVEYSNKLINTHDGMWDAPGMFAPGTTSIKECFSLILTAFNTFFAWPCITNEAYSKPLTYALIKLGRVDKGEVGCLKDAIQASVTYLKSCSESILDLSSAVSLVSLIETLISLQDVDAEDNVEIDLAAICKCYLQRKWYDNKGEELKNSLANKQQSVLLCTFLNFGDTPVERISEVLTTLVDEVKELDQNETISSFPYFKRVYMSVLIQCLCQSLHASTKRSLEGIDYKEQLLLWDKVIDSLNNLSIIVKTEDSKPNLRQFLKGTLPVLKLFVAQGVVPCSTLFKIESQLVSQLLKKLQQVTRYLQAVCNYSKVSKDGSMILKLPAVRSCLESVVLAVKNMVLKNRCTDAFFMGSMRNKGLRGEIIPTQDEDSPDISETPEVESSEQLTDDIDETSSVVTMESSDCEASNEV